SGGRRPRRGRSPVQLTARAASWMMRVTRPGWRSTAPDGTGERAALQRGGTETGAGDAEAPRDRPRRPEPEDHEGLAVDDFGD
ncbi:hypothetical protein ACWCSH_48185, partial [Streptosporangium sp. NPDC001682]